MEKFEQYIQDFGGIDPILDICNIDPVKVLHVLYQEYLFNPEELEGAFSDDD